MSRAFIRYHLPALGWATFIGFVMLAQPPEVTSVGSGPIWSMFALSSFWMDIIAHLIVFGVMGWLAARSLHQLGVARPVLASALLTLFYGTLIEVVQHFMPGRGLEIRDLVANGLGGWVGAWLASLGGARRR